MITPLKFAIASAVLVISVSLISVHAYRISNFFITQDQFTVMDSHDVCEQPLNNRCTRHYTILRKNKKKIDFVPFGGEFDYDYLPDGFEFSKKAFSFSYISNGKPAIWHELAYSISSFVLGAVLFLLWFFYGGLSIIKQWALSLASKFSDG